MKRALLPASMKLGLGMTILGINREEELALKEKSRNPILIYSHWLVLHCEKNVTTSYSNGGYGSDNSIPFEKVKAMLPVSSKML